VALIIQNGGLKFLHDLEFLSDKLLKVNPPLFHNIDPTTLPPKETTTTLKNARTDLIFESASKRKESCKSYPEFGFEQNEIDFVKAAVHVLYLLAKATAPEFDPCMEDMEVLERSKSKTGKRQITFQNSAVLVRNVMRITKGPGGRRMIRRSSSAGYVWAGQITRRNLFFRKWTCCSFRKLQRPSTKLQVPLRIPCVKLSEHHKLTPS